MPTAEHAPRIIAVTNQKGGVGKTTTAVNLADALARMGERPLVVDMDEQADATAILGVDPQGDHLNIFDVLMSEAPGTLGDAIQATDWEGVTLVPGTPDVAAFAVDPSIKAAEGRLRRAARGADLGGASIVLLDLPPSLGRLTLNGLTWATHALIVTSPERLGVLGVSRTVEVCEELQSEPELNPDLCLAGILVNGYDSRAAEHAFQRAELEKVFGFAVMRESVPTRTSITNTPSFKLPARSTQARSSRECGAVYAALASDLLERVGRK